MNLSRRNKYLLLSIATVLFLFAFSYTAGFARFLSALMVLAVGTLGTALVQYSSVQTEHDIKYFLRKTIGPTLVLPVILVVGALMSLVFYPNLGLPIRIITIFAVGTLMYAISLVNNIFLVVYERKEVIPLYRVAVTWSQILLIIVSIPFFSGIFKLPINGIYPSLIVAIAGALFAYFLMWFQEMDPDVPEIKREEGIVNAGLVAFLVFAFSIGTSFFPAKSFLRSLLVSSVLMSTLGYLQAHYKNAITKKLVAEYIFITVIFLLFVLLFN